VIGALATMGRCQGYGSDITWENIAMTDHVYKVVELVGSSPQSHADAIEIAISRAARTLRNLRWFEVVQMRGEIENGRVQHYQVTVKAGFTLDDA
jgi:flavin-binding protein dodecin